MTESGGRTNTSGGDSGSSTTTGTTGTSDAGLATSTGDRTTGDGTTGNNDTTGMTLEPLVLHLHPDGNDDADGRSWETALATLGRAHALLDELQPDRDVVISIASGTYVRQSVTWTYTMPDHSITFERADDDGARPVFRGCDGDGCEHTFFRLSHSDGEATNLHFEYLRIENYRTAISLAGRRDEAERSNSHNRIYGCYFDRIGNKWNDHTSESYAVVRLLNSDDNLIRNNHFVQSENATNPGLLHAIYAAHGAERNHIVSNRFVTQSGDPIRVRDGSNDNIVENNVFIAASARAVMSDWHCVGDHCTKPTPECASWENIFRDNHIDGNYACETATNVRALVAQNPACTSPPDALRLRSSGNTHTATPCEGL